MSSASARVSAMQAASSSPTWRTFSYASTGCTELRNPGSPEIGANALHAVEVGHDEDLVLVALRLGDAAHPRVRKRAAHKSDVQHARQPNVGDEPAAAAQIAVVLQAQNRRADAVVLSFCVSSSSQHSIVSRRLPSGGMSQNSLRPQPYACGRCRKFASVVPNRRALKARIGRHCRPTDRVAAYNACRRGVHLSIRPYTDDCHTDELPRPR